MNRELSVFPIGTTLSSTNANSIMSLCETFNSVVPCEQIIFERVSPESEEPRVFLYRIEAVDGRIWDQHITMDQPSNPKMTFEVGDQWWLTEFSNQRNVRNALVSLADRYPVMTKLVYEFTP